MNHSQRIIAKCKNEENSSIANAGEITKDVINPLQKKKKKKKYPEEDNNESGNQT